MKPKSNIVLSQLLYASKSFKPVLGNAFLSLSDGDQNRLIRKRWQELRRDPQFAELLAGPNDSSTPRQVVVLLQDAPVEYWPRPRGAIVVSCSEEMTPSIVLTLRSNNRLISMSPSCNGLVCIYDDLGMLLLFNPATKERLSLPRPPNDGFHVYHVLCHLVFLPLTMEYKAARVVSLLQDQSVITLCQVLTVGTRSWRTICELDNSVEHDENGVTIDGTLYWMSSKGYAKSREMAIHVFDVKYEGVRTIPLPNSEISDFRWETKLFEHDGSLCLFGRRQWQVNWIPSSNDYSLEEDDQIDVWMLKDVNDCVWAHIYHDPNCYPEPNCRWTRPVFLCNGKLMIYTGGDHIYYFDLWSNHFEVLLGDDKMRVTSAQAYVQNMFSLKDTFAPSRPTSPLYQDSLLFLSSFRQLNNWGGMKFWSVEVRPTETIKCKPGHKKLLHVSHASLWESDNRGTEEVSAFIYVNGQKIVLGTLSMGKCVPIDINFVFEQEFQLSHSSVNATVYFSGYKTPDLHTYHIDDCYNFPSYNPNNISGIKDAEDRCTMGEANCGRDENTATKSWAKLPKKAPPQCWQRCCISPDVIADILSRIPGSILQRFKFVCKQWHNLLNDPHFANFHLAQSRNRSISAHGIIPILISILIDKENNHKLREVIVKFRGDAGVGLVQRPWHKLCSDNPQFMKLIARPSSRLVPPQLVAICCHHAESSHIREYTRVVLIDAAMTLKTIMTIRSPFQEVKLTPSCNGLVCIYDDTGRMQLLNPTTRERLSLPRPTKGKSRGISHCYFGFSSPSREYKVVRFFYPKHESKFACEVLTIGTKSWRWIHIWDYAFHSSTGLTINGYLFLLKPRGKTSKETIEVFDLDKETFRTVALPDFTELYEYRDSLFEHEGSLCVLSMFNEKFAIWMLKDVENHVWIKVYQDFENLDRNLCYFWARPLFFHNGKLIHQLFWNLSLDYYDLWRNNNASQLLSEELIDVQPYEETLLSFKGISSLTYQPTPQLAQDPLPSHTSQKLEMCSGMDFWGVEVKAGKSISCGPGLGKLLHLSLVSLGKSENERADKLQVFVHFNDRKLVIGTLSTAHNSQIAFDLVFEETFELSHSSENATIYFFGYKTPDIDDYSDYDG